MDAYRQVRVHWRGTEESQENPYHIASGRTGRTSHAYAHLEDFNVPIRVGGLDVLPGVLIVADKHGAILIPEGMERPMIDLCKSSKSPAERLAKLMESEVVRSQDLPVFMTFSPL